MSGKLKDALQRRIDCWFAVGQALTKERAPYMIHCFAGELFIFQLSPAQAAGLMLAPNALCDSRDPRGSSRDSRPLDTPVSLMRFELDRPTLRPRERIDGAVEYEIEGHAAINYCLRLDYLLGLAGDEVIWATPPQPLEPSGKIRFSFDPPRESVWPFVQLHRGPIAVFLQMYSRSRLEEVTARHPISNTCGTLIDVGA
ncbi:MAG TPA: hypothetical protein VN541_08460 [Tepidisphaeraceae bacterium]|nr:hypothetical protein [Tepidisphaeraceae bacterium]